MKLGEIAAAKQNKTMNDTIARLRASKIEAESQAREEGRRIGQLWVREFATVKELEKLEAVE